MLVGRSTAGGRSTTGPPSLHGPQGCRDPPAPVRSPAAVGPLATSCSSACPLEPVASPSYPAAVAAPRSCLDGPTAVAAPAHAGRATDAQMASYPWCSRRRGTCAGLPWAARGSDEGRELASRRRRALRARSRARRGTSADTAPRGEPAGLERDAVRAMQESRGPCASPIKARTGAGAGPAQRGRLLEPCGGLPQVVLGRRVGSEERPRDLEPGLRELHRAQIVHLAPPERALEQRERLGASPEPEQRRPQARLRLCDVLRIAPAGQDWARCRATRPSSRPCSRDRGRATCASSRSASPRPRGQPGRRARARSSLLPPPALGGAGAPRREAARSAPRGSDRPPRQTLDAPLTRPALEHALAESGGNVTAAAVALGLHRTQLRRLTAAQDGGTRVASGLAPGALLRRQHRHRDVQHRVLPVVLDRDGRIAGRDGPDDLAHVRRVGMGATATTAAFDVFER